MTKQEQINIEKTFFKFLNDNNALNEYKINTINANIVSKKFPINSFALMPLKTLKDRFIEGFGEQKQRYEIFYENIIDFSFTWINTRQGHEFWKQLNHKWKTFFNSNFKQQI